MCIKLHFLLDSYIFSGNMHQRIVIAIIAVQPAFPGVYNYKCRTLGFPDVNTALLRRDDPDELFPDPNIQFSFVLKI